MRCVSFVFIRNVLLLIMFGYSCAANSITTDHEVGKFCKDCTYDEAKDIAKHSAVPNMTCRITSNSTDDYIENCYSLPKLYFVLNETTRRLNGFIVKHINQGKMRHELLVVAEDRSLSVDHTDLILEALDAKQLLKRNLLKAVQNFSYEINPSTGSVLSGSSQNKIDTVAPLAGNDPKANCANDPHSQALSDALNPHYSAALTRRLKEYIQQGIRSGQFEDQATALSKFSFGVTGIDVSATVSRRSGPEFSMAASWGAKERTSAYFDHEYYSEHDAESSSLRWIASSDAGEIVLGLSQHNSFVGGLSVAQLLGGGRKFKISPCIAKALADAFPNNTYGETKEFEDINSWYGPYPIVGNDWGNPPENSDRGWICEYSFKNHTGAKIAGFAFLARCP